jgi:hypothetical protein
VEIPAPVPGLRNRPTKTFLHSKKALQMQGFFAKIFVIPSSY